jgi:adenylate kinase family enzyme
MDFFDRTNPDRDLYDRGRTTRYDLIVIRGAPGVGKSTLSENLKKYFPDGIGIETDTLRKMINRSEWFPSTVLNGSTHHCDEQGIHGIEAAGAVGRSYLANGYRPVLIVDTFTIPHYNKIESFIHESQPAISYYIFALYCTDKELVSRLSRRMFLTRFTGRGTVFFDRESAIGMNEEVRNHRYSNETFIDTTGRSPKSVLNEALQILQ